MTFEQLELSKRLENYSPDDSDAAFPFTERLARDNSWSLDYARRVVREYKRFAFLAVTAGHPVTPSDEVDQAWHLHILYTKSYWKEFCAEVLGKPLHHSPTKGGGEECEKFHDWYARTMESYRRFFDEEPPADIWPDASVRFGVDIHFLRVNSERNWVIAKPRWLRRAKPRSFKPIKVGPRQFATTAIAALLVAGLTGCGSFLASGAWPFNLAGEEFLKTFVVAWAASLSLAAWLRWHLRAPADEARVVEVPSELDPYAVAYLSNKDNQAINAALVNLVHMGALKASPENGTMLRADPLPEDAHPFEKRVHTMVNSTKGSPVADIREYASSLAAPIADYLKSLHLLVATPTAITATIIPLLIALLVPAIGAFRIHLGLERGMPVGFLVALTIAASIVALFGFARRPHRNRRGDKVLADLKRTNYSLEGRTWSFDHGRSESDLPLAVGLFGLGALGTSSAEAEDLTKTLTPKNGSGGGCGGGCGGDGGGGCGGGCGGCGGCGG
jgi:uncharacterized protein (TIGR04222 family)